MPVSRAHLDSMSSSPHRDVEFDAIPDTSDKDHVSKSSINHPQDERAYRRLCFILTLMTLIIFVINVLQVSLLDYTTNTIWIIGCPAIVLAVFLVWLGVHIWSTSLMPHPRDFHHAFRHFLNHLSHRERQTEYCELEQKRWPQTLARFGVVATCLVNIILVEFVYMNVTAIPDYQKIVWRNTFNASQQAPAPSFAVIQFPQADRFAVLESNATALGDLCWPKRFNATDQYCLQNWTKAETAAGGTYYYVTFDGRNHGDLGLGSDRLDLWYAYRYNGSDDLNPIFHVASFSSNLLSQFETAYSCGLTTTVDILARHRNKFNLEPYSISDPFNRMERSAAKGCRNPSFRRYTGYNIALSDLALKQQFGDGNPICDVNDQNYDGAACWADIGVSFSSLLTPVYTSKRGTDWKRIFTDEGAILGYTAFFIFFFDIYAK